MTTGIGEGQMYDLGLEQTRTESAVTKINLTFKIANRVLLSLCAALGMVAWCHRYGYHGNHIITLLTSNPMEW